MNDYDFIGLAIFAILTLVASVIFLGITRGWKETAVGFLQLFRLILIVMIIDHICRMAGLDMDTFWENMHELLEELN